MLHDCSRSRCLCLQVLLAAFVVSLTAPRIARAQLDPEVNKPYRLQVVVRFAKDAQLTPNFRDRVQRALHDNLQGALGDLAVVEIVTKHPLLEKIEAQGLQQTLEGWKNVSDTTTHFVLIDYNQGKYQIQTMQHDGFTGLASPVLRRDATTDRLFVARIAALLIDRDLGVAGTMVQKGDEAIVTLKGGNLGVSMERWLKKDDVLAIARIQRAGKELRSQPVDGALLQVIDVMDGKGVYRCKLLNRKDRLPAPALAYRCVKLGTAKANLVLRLVDENTRKPLSKQVDIAQEGFTVKASETHVSDSDGFVQTKNAYAHVAYVKIISGGLVTARIPVEVIEGRVAVLPLFPDEKTDLLGDLELQRRRLERDILDSIEIEIAARRELNETKDLKVALQKANAGLASLKEDIDRLTRDLGLLSKRIKQENLVKLDLKIQEANLANLKDYRNRLEKDIGTLEDLIKKEGDPKQKELTDLVREAEKSANNADYDQAIKAYQQIVEKSVGLAPELGKSAAARLQELGPRWNTRSAAHKKARDFIYIRWPDLKTPEQLQRAMKEACDAFETCRKEGDDLSPQKLILVSVSHATSLKKLLEALPKDDPDQVEKLKLTGAVAEELGKLITDVTDYLSKPVKR